MHPPTFSTRSAPSTVSMTPGGETAPRYRPRNWGEGAVQLLDQHSNLVGELVPSHLVGNQHNQRLGSTDPLQDGFHGRTKFSSTAPGLDRDRLHILECVGNDAFHLCHRVVWREAGPRAGGCSGDGDEVPDLAISQGVVQVSFRPGQAHRRSTYQVEHGQVFRFGSHDTVQGTEFTHAIGGGEHGTSMDPRVSVGRVRGIQFVGGHHPCEIWMFFHCIIDGKCKITWQTEHVSNAQPGQAVHRVLRHRGHLPAKIQLDTWPNLLHGRMTWQAGRGALATRDALSWRESTGLVRGRFHVEHGP
eukprot:scaffold1314_cov386-Pavlova_lutheri.AAC.5